MINLTGLKWSKNVNYQGSVVFWSFPIDSISKIFLLHWKNPSGDNVSLPKEGELIVLRQYSHVTHIVKLFNNTVYNDGSGSEFHLGRLIQVVWMASDFKNLPNYKEVFGCPIIFPPDGKVHLLEFSYV